MTTTNDTQLGRRVAALRAAAGMTQADLTKAMRSLGHDWVQSTVSSIESQAKPRPLRATELFDIAHLFGVEPAEFVSPPNELEAIDAHRRLWKEASELFAAVSSTMLALNVVRRIDTSALPPDLAATIRQDQTWTIEQLVRDDMAEASETMTQLGLEAEPWQA